MVEQNKIAAYGFNYDAVVVPENNDFKINDLISDKVAAIKGIKSAGVNILFEKDDAAYVLEIKPISEQKFVAHFNAHFSTNKLPDTKELKEKIDKEFLEFENTIKEI